MRKSYCDRCQKDCTYNERVITCNSGANYLWLDNPGNANVGKDLLLCVTCKGDFEAIIRDFVKSLTPS